MKYTPKALRTLRLARVACERALVGHPDYHLCQSGYESIRALVAYSICPHCLLRLDKRKLCKDCDLYKLKSHSDKREQVTTRASIPRRNTLLF